MDCIWDAAGWNVRRSLDLFIEYNPSIVDVPEQAAASESIHITFPQPVVQSYAQPHAEHALVVWCVLPVARCVSLVVLLASTCRQFVSSWGVEQPYSTRFSRSGWRPASSWSFLAKRFQKVVAEGQSKNMWSMVPVGTKGSHLMILLRNILQVISPSLLR
jgi:hypothetical protein